MIKAVVMDDLKNKFPEKFNESGAMDYKWFEAEIRPNHNTFIRKDVESISFSFDVANAPLTKAEAIEFLEDYLDFWGFKPENQIPKELK